MKAIILLLLIALPFAAQAQDAKGKLEARVEALFDRSNDLLEVKLAVDAMVDPTVDKEALRYAIGRMESEIRIMADATDSASTLAALKRFLYVSGSWNDHQPFQYDLNDPLGEKPENRLLHQYLSTHRGNCVTMPILLIVLGQRLGLTMTLAEAPLHLFVKYTDATGKVWNLEATSGGGPTRDIWYRQKLPMSDQAIASGIYLRALSRDETIATIAGFLVEHLLATGAYEKAIVIADILLRHSPDSVYLMTKKGTAYYRLLERDVIAHYRRQEDIPTALRTRADIWYRENTIAFSRAEALGWRPWDGQMQ